MLRRLSNQLKGRKKTMDEFLGYNEVLNLLDSLDNTSVNIEHFCIESSKRCNNRYNVSPNKAAKFVEIIKKSPNEGSITPKAKHEVYSRKKDEKHYIDLKKEGNKIKDYATLYWTYFKQ